MRRRYRIVSFFACALAFTGVALAQPTPSHPLSHISPTDTDFDFSNNAQNTGHNITGLPAIDPAGQQLMLLGNLDMEGNDIQDFFGSQCPSNQAILQVFDNGSYRCGAAPAGLPAVLSENNTAGQHNLNMFGNRIENLGSADSSDDAMPRGDILNEFVDEAGDQMDGNLDMQGNELRNVDRIGNGSNAMAVTSTVAMQGNTLQNPGSITSYYGTACGAGEAVQDVSDDGTFTCVDTTDATEDAFVNETGDNMSGRLGMQGNGIFRIGPGEINISAPDGDIQMNNNRIEQVQDPDSGDDAVSQDFADLRYVDEAGDAMTGDLDMTGKDIKNVDTIGNGTINLAFQQTGAVRVPNGRLRVDSGIEDISQAYVDFQDGIRMNGNLFETEGGNVDLAGGSVTAVDDISADTTDSEINLTDTTGIGGVLRMYGNTVQNPGSITAYFDTACAAGEAIQDINNDGTFTCIDTTDASEDVWVNETGDTMSGILNMGSNRIEGVASHDSGDDVMRQDDIDTTYVNEAGDSMTGNLDMTGGDIKNVDTLGNGTVGIALEGTGAVRVPNGRLRVDSGIEDISQAYVDFQDGIRMNGNLFETEGGNIDLAGGSITTVDTIGADTGDNAVNVTDTIDAGGNRVEGLGAANSGDDAMRRDNIQSQFVDAAGDLMTGNLDMNGNELRNVDRIGNGSNAMAVTSTVAMQGNTLQNPGSITSYYGSACPDGHAIVDVNNDGTFTCVSLAGEVSDAYVNETGDNMSGRLGMQGNGIFRIGPGEINISAPDGDIQMNNNRIEGLQAADSGDDAMRQDTIDTTYVNEGGDTMTGNLDMSNNDVKNIRRAGIGTSSPSHNLDVDGNASVSNQGTSFEVDSDGDITVTLGG